MRLSHADDLKLSSLHSRAAFRVSGPSSIILYRAMDPLAAASSCDFFSVGVVVSAFFIVCGVAAPTATRFPGRVCHPVWLLVWCVWSPHALTLKLLGTIVEQVYQVSGRVLFLYRALVPLAVSCFFECNECAAAVRPLHSGCALLLLWACCDHAVFPGAFVVLEK